MKKEFKTGDLVVTKVLAYLNKRLLGVIINKEECQEVGKKQIYSVYFNTTEKVYRMLADEIENYEYCDSDHILW